LLAFLGVDADHRLARGLMLLDLLVDIAELWGLREVVRASPSGVRV
jgi:hypothetical protein